MGMNLAQVIHQRWAGTAGLNAVLPGSRVFTGMSVDPSLPFAVIGKQSDRPHSRYNDGSSVRTVGLRIEVFHHNYDSAAAIIAQIDAAFDNAAFPLAGADRVLNMQRTDGVEEQKPDGVWRMAVEFACTVYLEA
jgi:hypothetical protein